MIRCYEYIAVTLIILAAVLGVMKPHLIVPEYNVSGAIESYRFTDFIVLDTAAQLLHQKPVSELYNLQAQHDVQMQRLGIHIDDTLSFLYPPPIALPLLLVPRMPLKLEYSIWQIPLGVASFGLVLGLWWLAKQNAKGSLLLITFLLVTFVPWINATAEGQPMALIALGIVASWWLVKHNYGVLTGILLVALAVKPQAILLPATFMLIIGGWPVFFGAAGAGLVLAVATTLVMGAGIWASYLSLVQMAYTVNGRYGIGLDGMTDLRAFLFHIWGDSHLDVLNIVARIVYMVAIIAVVGLGLWARKADEEKQRLLFAVSIVLGVLAAPVMHLSTLLLLAISIAILLTNAKRNMLMALLAAQMTFLLLIMYLPSLWFMICVPLEVALIVWIFVKIRTLPASI